MDDKKKMALAVIAVVVAVAAAGFMGFKALAPPKENIVGSLDGTGPGANMNKPVKGMRDAAVGNPPPTMGEPNRTEGARGQ
ncbi:MAG: hypothetical protein QM758_09175 [Armatimonas sp.]